MSANDGDLVDRMAKKHSVSPAAVQVVLAAFRHVLGQHENRYRNFDAGLGNSARNGARYQRVPLHLSFWPLEQTHARLQGTCAAVTDVG